MGSGEFSLDERQGNQRLYKEVEDKAQHLQTVGAKETTRSEISTTVLKRGNLDLDHTL